MKEFIKKRWRYILVAVVALVIGSSVGPSDTEFNEVQAENTDLGKQSISKDKQITELKEQNKQLQAKVDEAAPFFKLSKVEQDNQIKEAEAKAAVLEEKEAEEKAKREAEEKAAAEAEEKRLEAEEKKGYETGITYDQLARTPDDYLGEKVKFKGKVIQVIEGDGDTQIRFAVNDNYDTILFGLFDSSIVTSRVLEDDTITIMGLSTGLLSYESTMGGNISIPGMTVEKIEQ
ncbi:toxin regulator [Metabacillus sp. 113a]|uniref:toxin regulator n=1 Tax=Metabacillus sp. 113a TaxID=3404706 RepID=UPI003CEA996A